MKRPITAQSNRYGRLFSGLVFAVALLVLAACGADDVIVSVDSGAAAAPGEGGGNNAMSLDDVDAACDQAVEGPGIAIIDRDLRDANVSIDLPDCILHLENGADIQLNNVEINGGILNIHDRATDPSHNRIKLQRVRINAEALLIELNDADDELQTEATQITTVQGIGIRVAGTDEDANDGGDIRLVGSSLLSTDLDATIHILASEHSGTIRLVNTTVDTQGLLTVLANDCEARLDGDKLDCSTATLEAKLNG